MALVQPSDSGRVPDVGVFTDAQFGSVAELLVANACMVAAPGSVALASPLLDLGFDLYLRRIRTLRVVPIQVKARSFLSPDGEFQVSVSSLLPDPRGYVVMPYVPPPTWQLAQRLWAIPIPDFLKIAQPHGDGYLFASYLDDRFPGPASKFLVEVTQLRKQWLGRIPGWNDPIAGPPFPMAAPTEEVGRAASRALGRFGELWLAAKLMRSTLENVAIAQDRLRVDCVDLLLHDVRSFAVAGISVHTSSINARGIVQFRLRHQTFFIDGRLYVVILIALGDGGLHDTAFLIPAAEVPAITTVSADRGDPGYQGSFRLDPLAEKMRPYAIPSDTLGPTILERLFPRS